MSHLTSAWFTVLLLSDLSFLQKKKTLLLYIRKRKSQLRQAFRIEHFFLFTEGIKVIENPRNELLYISQWQSTIAASNKPTQHISPQFHFSPQPGNTFEHRQSSLSRSDFAISALSQCQQPKGKGHFWGRGCHWWGISAGNTEGLAGRGISGMELLLLLLLFPQQVGWTCLKNTLCDVNNSKLNPVQTLQQNTAAELLLIAALSVSHFSSGSHKY